VVVGFKADPKACGYILKLTRGDGTIVDDTMSATFWVLNTGKRSVNCTATYNAETQKWTVLLDQSDPDVDPSGYHYVSYYCVDAIATQYPGRYKTADKGIADDAIAPGSYEDTIPYFRWEQTTFIQTITWDDMPSTDVPYSGKSGLLDSGLGTSVVIAHGQSVTEKYTVWSSVPYQVEYECESDSGSTSEGSFAGPNGCDGDCNITSYVYNNGFIASGGVLTAVLCNYSISFDGAGTYSSASQFKYTYPPATSNLCIPTATPFDQTENYTAAVSGREHTITVTNTTNNELDYTLLSGWPDGTTCYFTGAHNLIRLNGKYWQLMPKYDF